MAVGKKTGYLKPSNKKFTATKRQNCVVGHVMHSVYSCRNASSGGQTLFLSHCFEGCLSRRHSVTSVEKGGLALYELLKNMHQDCMSASKMCTVFL